MENCRVCFHHLWESEDFSDVQLVFKAPSVDPQQYQDAVLHRMPAHKAILSLSPYFRAQLVRWSSDSSSGSGTGVPTVALGLESPEQLPAALAVLAAMYGIPPDTDTLPDHQLLRMILLADMLQLGDITHAAVQQLLLVLSEHKSLSALAVQQLTQLPALPGCLMAHFPTLAETLEVQDCVQLWLRSTAAPAGLAGLDAVMYTPHSIYVQQRLCRWVRDLDACLDSAETRQQLLRLPLPAMVLVLASDSLPVHSEDTILFTAQAYISAQASPEQQQEAAQQLAPLVRCPYLSQLWLTAMVASPYAGKLLLGPYTPQIQRVLPYLMAYGPAGSSTAREAVEAGCSVWQQLVPDAPISWSYPQRPPSSFRSADTVKLFCSFDIPAVHELFSQAVKKQRSVFLASKQTTRPLCGLVWRLELHACWQAHNRQATLGLFAAPVNCPSGMFFRYNASISCGPQRRAFAEPADAYGNKGSGFTDFFGLGPVRPADGWSPLLHGKLSDALTMPDQGAAGWVWSELLRDAGTLKVTLTVSKAD